MNTAPKKQIHPESWWRYPGRSRKFDWNFTLYIAHPNGMLEGCYNTTINGDSAIHKWDQMGFRRDSIVGLNKCWEFICELK